MPDQPAISLWSETNHVLTLSFGINADGVVPPQTPGQGGTHGCLEFPLNAISLRPGIDDVLYLDDVSWDPDDLDFSTCGPAYNGNWPDYTGHIRDDELRCDPDDDGSTDYVIPVGAPKANRIYDLEPMSRCGYAPEAENFPSVNFDRESILSPATIPGEFTTPPTIQLAMSANAVLSAAISQMDFLGYQLDGLDASELTMTFDFPDPATATVAWDLLLDGTILDPQGNKIESEFWIALNQAPVSDLFWAFGRASQSPVCE